MEHKWLVQLTSVSNACAKLICLPYAGGGAASFRPWAQASMPNVEILAIELPGRGSRMSERPYICAEGLIGALTDAIWPHLSQPFALFGHSMGALIAFELARSLRVRYGVVPMHLFVSAHRAPHLPDTDPFIDRLPDHKFLAKIQALGGIDTHMFEHEAFVEHMLPTLRADIALCKSYTYQPSLPLECPITAFCGEQDGSVSCTEIAGWQAHTVNTWQLHSYPGGHFFIREQQTHMLAAIHQALTQGVPVTQ